MQNTIYLSTKKHKKFLSLLEKRQKQYILFAKKTPSFPDIPVQKMKKSSPLDKKKKVLLYYSTFQFGGGEYLPMLFMKELLERGYDVTLLLRTGKELIAPTADFYEIDIDLKRINIVVINPTDFPFYYISQFLFFCKSRKIKKMAKDFDICISASNIFDFGKKAYHIINSASFFHPFIHSPPPTGLFSLNSKVRTFVHLSKCKLFGLRPTKKIITDSGEHIYVPSRYIAEIMHSLYGPFNWTLFYPPTIFEPDPSIQIERDPLRVIYLGRIYASKGIHEIIGIVERARALSGFNIQLCFAGPMNSTFHRDGLTRTVENKSWIHFSDPVYKKDKAAFLLSGSYAIHAMREEAFGISITEYLKVGCIPIVPDEGGTAEIVANPELIYHTNEDASQILIHLLTDDAFRREQLARCKERAKVFSAERYMESQRRILDSILGEQT